MKPIILLLTALNGVAAFGATPIGFACSIRGHYEGPHSPSNTHGVYSEEVTYQGTTQEEAEDEVTRKCESLYSGSCTGLSCHPVYVMIPFPLGPDTEISCSDDQGVQVEIIVGRPHYDRVAIIRKDGTVLGSVPIQANLPANESHPTSYTSESSTFYLELLIRSSHLFLTGPAIHSDGPVSCIRPAPKPSPPGGGCHSYCGGHH